MASDNDNLIETLIVDSAGFLKNVQLQNIAKNIYTVQEVISEIKSVVVREQLAVLPYEIKFRLPSSESLHVVSAFAKKTGDFQSLSVVDLNVLALTYQLHKEKCGTDDLRKEPTKQVQVVDKQQHGTMPGFFVGPKGRSEDQKIHDKNDNVNKTLLSHEELTNQLNECSLNEINEKNSETVRNENIEDKENRQHEKRESIDNCVKDGDNEDDDVKDDHQCAGNKYQNNDNCVNDGNGGQKDGNKYQDNDGDGKDDQHCGDKYQNNDNCINDGNDSDQQDGNKYQGNDDQDNGHDDDDDGKDDGQDDQHDDKYHNDGEGDNNHDYGIFGDDDDTDDDNDDDWISPSNISQIKADMNVVELETKPTNVVVGCLTTDFAMQNVLLQMGLHVISIDGMLIKEARSYVLKCYSCFKVTTQMERVFCPKCGNRTMVKVSVSVDQHGVTQYHMPKRNRPFNIRGKKHPLPLPKGGRHSSNPLLFEDQLLSQKRLPKTKDKMNVFDENYVARSSPFAANDTTSRAFNLGFHIHGSNRRNPNEVREKTRRKKK